MILFYFLKLGPCKISPISYKLERLKNIRIHSIIHVSEFDPFYVILIILKTQTNYKLFIHLIFYNCVNLF